MTTEVQNNQLYINNTILSLHTSIATGIQSLIKKEISPTV